MAVLPRCASVAWFALASLSLYHRLCRARSLLSGFCWCRRSVVVVMMVMSVAVRMRDVIVTRNFFGIRSELRWGGLVNNCAVGCRDFRPRWQLLQQVMHPVRRRGHEEHQEKDRARERAALVMRISFRCCCHRNR